jgi:hypothetical protein
MNPLMMSDIVYYIFDILPNTRHCIAVCHLWRRIFLLHPDYEIWQKWKNGVSYIYYHILRHGNIKIIRSLEPFHDPHDPCLAAKNNHLDVLKYMFDQLVDSSCIETFLITVSRYGRIDFIQHLMNTGRKALINYNDLIIVASQYGQLALIKYLITLGAYLKSKYKHQSAAVFAAIRNGHLEVLKYLRSINTNVTMDSGIAIARAADGGHLDMVKYLISVDDNSNGLDVAVRMLAHRGRYESVKQLIKLGAKADMKSIFTNRCTAHIRFLGIARYLKARKADLTANDSEAVVTAFSHDEYDMVESFICVGADATVVWRRVAKMIREVILSSDGRIGLC